MKPMFSIGGRVNKVSHCHFKVEAKFEAAHQANQGQSSEGNNTKTWQDMNQMMRRGSGSKMEWWWGGGVKTDLVENCVEKIGLDYCLISRARISAIGNPSSTSG